MYGEQGFKAVHKTIHLITEIYRQRLLNFFSSAYITLIITKDMKYCMVPIRTSQAAQQQNKLMQFLLVCANFEPLFSLETLPQASENHIKARFSL